MHSKLGQCGAQLFYQIPSDVLFKHKSSKIESHNKNKSLSNGNKSSSDGNKSSSDEKLIKTEPTKKNKSFRSFYYAKKAYKCCLDIYLPSELTNNILENYLKPVKKFYGDMETPGNNYAIHSIGDYWNSCHHCKCQNMFAQYSYWSLDEGPRCTNKCLNCRAYRYGSPWY